MSGNISELEHALGFKHERSLSGQTAESMEVPQVYQLTQDIKRFMSNFANRGPAELRSSTAFDQACDALFAFHGPRIWPARNLANGCRTSAWLVDARVKDWDGLWPRNLTYVDPQDQQKLRSLFRMLLLAKCTHSYYRVQGRARQTQELKFMVQDSADGDDSGSDGMPIRVRRRSKKSQPPSSVSQDTACDGSDSDEPLMRKAMRLSKRHESASSRPRLLVTLQLPPAKLAAQLGIAIRTESQHHHQDSITHP